MIMDGMGTKKGSLFHRVSLYLIVVSPPTAISYTVHYEVLHHTYTTPPPSLPSSILSGRVNRTTRPREQKKWAPPTEKVRPGHPSSSTMGPQGGGEGKGREGLAASRVKAKF